jgi:protein gp37
VTGCTTISPGCDHCFARVFAERWRGVPGHAYQQGFDLTLRPERLTTPLRWRKPRRIFVNSMSDLFHRDVPDAFIRDVFDIMRQADWHTFQVLTKRAKRLARFVAAHPDLVIPPHVWLGVSIETDAYTWRADLLRRVAAPVRFISAEPLLGPLPSLNLTGIHWLIVGGESGHGARPLQLDWARALRNQCQAADTAFFMKQVGRAHARRGKGSAWADMPADLRIRDLPDGALVHRTEEDA